jgi:DNA-binding beta-propeller fold protein YncE
LYVTGLDGNGIRHIGALELDGTTWTSAASDAFPNLDAESPVVFSTASGWTMLFANRVEGIDRIDRASSTDGLAWTVDNEGVVPEGTNWESAGRIPHSVQRLDDGRLRLWYSGTDGSRYRIGSAISDDDGVSFTIELGLTDDYRFGTGQPGEFDDTQVRDPMVVEIDGVVHLWYSAFDGSEWYIGKATLDETGEWVRHISPAFDVVAPLLSGLDRSFSDQGAWSPVVVNDDGERTVWYAGNDGARDRIGRAFGSSDDVYPQHFVPTADDTITFELERGDDTITAITLDQTIEGFSTLGPDGSQALSDDDPTSAVYDEERGFLYVTQKLSDFIFVLDVRDDSRPGFDDRNYLDIEALLRIRTIPVLTGFRDVALSDDGLLYATSRSPETVMILDISNVEDNAEKDLIYYEDVASLPLQDLSEDEGAPSMGGVGGATLALNQEQNLLIATHFRDNSVSIFDLRLGDWGQEVRYLPELGENPYRVRISPDGRYAVVANYVGDIVDNWVSSTLVVIDIDPASDTYLEAVTWIANL